MTDLQKRWGIVAVFVLIFVLLINFCPRLIYFNITRSMPIGLYIAIPGMNLRTGDYVVFDAPEKAKSLILERNYGDGNPDRMFLKRVGALPGDIYGVMDDVLLVNGEKKGDVLLYDHDGNPMPVEEGFHMVRKGTFLPLGDKVNSLDGRYFGTVPVESIRMRVVPLITEW